MCSLLPEQYRAKQTNREETERERHRETEILKAFMDEPQVNKGTETERQRDTESDSQRDREGEIQRDSQRERDRHIDTERDRQTDPESIHG